MRDDVRRGADETLDDLSCGGLRLLQKRRGYRFSLDAYLLAALVCERPASRVLDIGAGSGVVAILLAGVKGLSVTGVEVQEGVCEMARRSVRLNRLDERIQIVHGDIRNYRGEAPFDVVVANPPYRPLATGRMNPDQSRAVSRHELLLDLDTLLSCTYNVLNEGGRCYLIYPAWRLTDLLYALREHGIEPKTLVMIHSLPEGRADLCLVRGVRGGGRELRVERPFYIYAAEKAYSPQMERVFRELELPKSD